MERQGGRKRGADGAATAAVRGGRALVKGHERAVMPKQRIELGETNGCWAPPVVAMSRSVHMLPIAALKHKQSDALFLPQLLIYINNMSLQYSNSSPNETRAGSMALAYLRSLVKPSQEW